MRGVHPLPVVLAAAMAAACGGAPGVTEISQTPLSAHEPSLAAFADGLVASWYDTRDGHGEIYARALGPEGVPSGPEWRLTSTDHDSFEADIHALGEHDFVIGWYEKSDAKALTPRLGRWSRNGHERWVTALAPTGRNTVVRVDGDAIFAAWVQDEDADRAGVWAGWWRATGEVAVAPRRVADASRTTWNLNAAVAPSSRPGSPGAWIVFDARVGTLSDEIFAVEVGATTVVVTRLTADDAISSKYPDASPAGDRVAITWFDTVSGNEDVYLAVGPASRLLRSDALTRSVPRRVTNTPGHSIGAYLTWNGERVGLAWCDDSVGQHEVYVQSFDASGQPAGEAVRVTDTPASSLIPVIRPWRSGFILAWSEYVAARDGSHGEGRGQIAMAVIP